MFIKRIKTGNRTLYNIDTIIDKTYLLSLGVNIDKLEEEENLRLNTIKNRQNRKMNADFKGTNLSLSSEDAMGLLQVQSALQLGVKNTMFKFKNGTVFKITADNFTELSTWFAIERNKLFE